MKILMFVVKMFFKVRDFTFARLRYEDVLEASAKNSVMIRMFVRSDFCSVRAPSVNGSL